MITVAIIEDHDLFREGIAHALLETGAVHIHSATASLAEFDSYATPNPDVVLTDLHLQGNNPLRALCARGRAVLAMSAAAAPDEMLSAIHDGARGYLSKDASIEETLRALQIIADGHRYVSPTLASVLLRWTDARTDVAQDRPTPEERQVLSLITQGEHETDIADQLTRSVDDIRQCLDEACDRVRTTPTADG